MSPAEQETMRQIKPWLSLVARLGFAAKGTIYLMIGLLAVTYALGFTDKVEDMAGTIEVVSQKHFGVIALLLLAFGLFNYGLWNAVQAVWDPERVGGNWVGNALRVIFGFSALLNLFLAYKTASVALGHGWGGATGDAAVQSSTEQALVVPGGRALVLVAATVMAGIALSLVVRLVRGKYMNLLAARDRTGISGALVKGCAWYGFLAQAVVAALIAWFLWRAALTAQPEEAGGFTKALATLFNQRAGRTLLALTGAGVMAQGLYIWLMVPYREIRVKQGPSGFRDHWGRVWGIEAPKAGRRRRVKAAS
jgi:hypothetical protein